MMNCPNVFYVSVYLLNCVLWVFSLMFSFSIITIIIIIITIIIFIRFTPYGPSLSEIKIDWLIDWLSRHEARRLPESPKKYPEPSRTFRTVAPDNRRCRGQTESIEKGTLIRNRSRQSSLSFFSGGSVYRRRTILLFRFQTDDALCQHQGGVSTGNQETDPDYCASRLPKPSRWSNKVPSPLRPSRSRQQWLVQQSVDGREKIWDSCVAVVTSACVPKRPVSGITRNYQDVPRRCR